MLNNIRNYSVTDSRMIETAYTLHSLFNDHIAEFTLLDVQLDAAFATTWYAKIDAASTMHRDSQIKDIQAQLTEEVEVQMNHCRVKFKEIKYFADKAFPNNPKLLDEFGAESFGDIRNKHHRMVNFMDEVNLACIKYTTELLAAGMTQTQIDDVLALRNAVLAANTEQENYIRARPLLTKNRVAVLNECYTQTMKVVEAAMIVYHDDETSRNMFKFNRTGSSSGGSDGAISQENVQLTILTNNQAQLVYAVPYEPTREYIIINNGPAVVEFYIAPNLNGMGSPVIFAPGENQTVTADMLGMDGDLLIAKALIGTGADATVDVTIILDV